MCFSPDFFAIFSDSKVSKHFKRCQSVHPQIGHCMIVTVFVYSLVFSIIVLCANLAPAILDDRKRFVIFVGILMIDLLKIFSLFNVGKNYQNYQRIEYFKKYQK